MAAQGGVELIVLVNCLIQDATRLGASDLHIEPWENSIAVRARVNGVLTEIAHLPRLSPAAERMLRYRERRRLGLSCIKVELRRREVECGSND